MAKREGTPQLLARVTDICLAFPEAVLGAFGHHATFSVRQKKFAYFLDSHHGDGITALCVKIEPEDRELLMRADSGRFYKPAYIGHQGWMGCRLDLGDNDWEQLRELVFDSYCIQASKKLAAELIAAAE